MINIEELQKPDMITKGDPTSTELMRRMNNQLEDENLYAALMILKQTIKDEMLEEMRKRIENIDTFYRV